MAIYQAKISFPMDTSIPRDEVTINPCYTGDDPQALANALKTNLIANTMVGATKPFKIRVYDAQKEPPSYPLAEATSGTGFSLASHPRELALCLSYYSTVNRPGRRGRVYWPLALIAGATGQRPATSQMTSTMTLGPSLGKSLPTGTAWVVYSRKADASFPITNYWVDDEWDVVRSRGLKGTTRQLGTVP